MTYSSEQPHPDSWASVPPAPPAGPPPAGPPSGGTGWRRRHRATPAVAAILVAGTTAASVAAGHYLWPASGARASALASGPSGSTGSSPSGVGGSGSSGSSSLGGGSPFYGGPSGASPYDGSGSAPAGGSTGGTSAGAGAPADVSGIASKVDPALVDINTNFGYQSASGAGTGIVLSSNGVVLTNNHVINGATSISVTDLGNGRTYQANVLGYDKSADVAVIKLQGASGLQTARLGQSSAVKVGQPVVAIGNAGGAGGTPSAAGGSVTALGRAITASDSLTGTSEQLTGLIQVDADVQPGDSGGPLVDEAGQVIGMDTAASSTYSLQSQASAGFAIPIDTALGIAHQIQAGRSSSTVHVGPTAFLGVSISAANTAPSSGTPGGFGGFGGFDPGGYSSGSGGSGYGYPGGSTGSASGGATVSGVGVSGVVSGGAAARAGLAAGDTITAVNGQAISSPDALSQAIAQDRPGDRVQLTWTDQSGQSHTTTVDLGSGPPA
ncbi:MAG TPA: trypsin-like peptidase domain-containing protein [Acidimicrobiales bacterium]|nr:trypsin-like peptidase domain-containing protein [Acidimicrobiales bacterium]